MGGTGKIPLKKNESLKINPHSLNFTFPFLGGNQPPSQAHGDTINWKQKNVKQLFLIN